MAQRYERTEMSISPPEQFLSVSFELYTKIPVVLLYDLDPNWPQTDIEDRLNSVQLLYDALVEVGHPVQVVCIQSEDLETALKNSNPNENIVLNWCEELPGMPHSEPIVAQILEQQGFTFTGAGASALVTSQDKRRIKKSLQSWRIPTPPWQVYTSSCNVLWKVFPAIVKPAFEHCSYGITRGSVVTSPEELVQQIECILDEFHQPAIVEEFIDGREFHVGIIGNGKLQVLPPGEIDYSPFEDIHDRLCTYESNFDKTSLAYKLTLPKLPVFLTEDQLRRLENIVVSAYHVTGCRDYARMDIRLRDGTFYLLDANSNPDISSDTSFVLGAGLIGLSYGRLGSLLINLAAHRHFKFKSLF